MRMLVVSSSKHGSTEGIAEAIAERLRQLGNDAVAVRVGDVDNLEGIEAVVLGSAVYAGSWMKDAIEFADAHAETLAAMPVWLFSSGPLGNEVHDEEEQPSQLTELSRKLQPEGHRVFFGSLDIGKLAFGERMMIKAVKAPEGDFRDWGAIGRWADEIAQEVA